LATYIVRGLRNSVPNASDPSGRTANADLSAADWTAGADSSDATLTICPRGFVANAAGLLSFKAMHDSSNVTMYVVQGGEYAVALRSVNRAGCAAALQIAAALTLLY
jgi:hypothetical protein